MQIFRYLPVIDNI